MYRQYEDPYKLEQRLGCVRSDYDRYLKETPEDEIDLEMLCAFQESIADYEERINFAWQDMYADD